MSIENVTYAFQVTATNGNGFSVFLKPVRACRFRMAKIKTAPQSGRNVTLPVETS
jgi:hypothetical protein